jgi:hypothetical protein
MTMLNLILEACDPRLVGNGITCDDSNGYPKYSYSAANDGVLIFCWILIALLLIFLLIVCPIWFYHAHTEVKRISTASSDELQVGMTREEVIDIMTNHAFMGSCVKNYSTDSDGTMYFITKYGSFGIAQERLVVEFNKNNKVKSWHTIPF